MDCLCDLFLHWLFPREPFMTGLALAFHLSLKLILLVVILWSPFSRCTYSILSVRMNMVLANKICIVPRSPVISLLAWRFSLKRHLTLRGRILLFCFHIFIPALQFVLSKGGRHGIMELLRDHHSHVVYVAWPVPVSS